jgi:hypothetical protein
LLESGNLKNRTKAGIQHGFIDIDNTEAQ